MTRFDGQKGLLRPPLDLTSFIGIRKRGVHEELANVGMAWVQRGRLCDHEIEASQLFELASVEGG